MGDRGAAAELTTALAAVARSEGWGHCWADAFLSGPLGQATRLGARDPGWPEFRVPGERLRGSGGAVLVMGSEVLLRGRAPAQHTRWLFSRRSAGRQSGKP